MNMGKPVAARLWIYLVCVGLIGLGHLGCSQKTTGSKTIGVTLLTKEHVFYRDLESGLRDTAQEKGFDLLITSGDWDLAKQQGQIENFIVQKVAAIIVCPVNSKGIGPAIEKASQAKIPVFTADIKSDSGPVVSHIASDNYLGGKLAGDYMIKALDGKGKVAIIDQPIVESTIERVRGFEEVLRQYPAIRIVAKPNGDGVRDKAMKAAEDLLQGYPDLNGIFGINDDSALGALSAIESAGRRGIVVIGFDAIPEARAAILRESSLKADVVQNPKEIGQKTIEIIDRYLKGETVPAVIPVEVKVVDKAILEKK
ncbi:MAG TPA: substrate-binding domain-containing protein [Terriglobia bacterium]|nr:substrate-binding domain-containing protein [Terriglobia bacterium]